MGFLFVKMDGHRETAPESRVSNAGHVAWADLLVQKSSRQRSYEGKLASDFRSREMFATGGRTVKVGRRP